MANFFRHLVYMRGTRLQYNVVVSLIVSAKSVEVLIELSEDCYCYLSVPIPNRYTVVDDK